MIRESGLEGSCEGEARKLERVEAGSKRKMPKGAEVKVIICEKQIVIK